MLQKSHFSIKPIIVLFSLNVVTLVRGEFNIPVPKISKLEARATIDVSQPCGNDLKCTEFDSTSCKNAGVCKEGIECTGRSNSPASEYPLENWTPAVTAEGCVIRNSPPDPPSPILFGNDDAKTLTVNGSAEGLAQCYIQRNSSTSSIFTLTFWLKAKCTNCSVLEMVQNGKPSIHLRVVQNDLCVDSVCDPGNQDLVSSNRWILVSVRVIESQLRIIAGDTVLDFKVPFMDNVSITNLYIGSGEIVPINDIFQLTSVIYYRDALTEREIKDLISGLTSPIMNPECRCPIDFLDLDDANETMCTNGTDNYPRFNSVPVLNEPDAMVDDDPLTNWSSSKEGAITLTLDFGQSYQLESIEIAFESRVPSVANLTLIYDGKEARKQNFLCQQQTCKVQTATLDSSSSVMDLKIQLAESIKIVLHRQDSSDVGSFIISSIKATGWCNCYGNAQTCVVEDDSYTCECENSTNTEGPSCRSCLPNNFRMSNEFECPRSCDCDDSGVLDVNDQCEELNGSCKCKENVNGGKCDVCKSNTYNLAASNPKGCSDCPCYEKGTVLCNNVTGTCVCKANTQLPNCDVCEENNYGLESPEGCQPCGCVEAGTVQMKKSCDSTNGQCECKVNVEGRTCQQCKPGFFQLETANPKGCQNCDCHKVGVEHHSCNRSTGQCHCRGGVVTDEKCKPDITSVDPSYGPRVGGTLVTIMGKLLGNDTHQISVFLDDVEQDLISVNDDAIVFRSTVQNVSAQTESVIKVSWQQVSSPISSPTMFTRLNDPQIDESKTSDVTTFVSGGCSVMIYGTNLRSVKYPKLKVMNVDNPVNASFGDCKHVLDYILCGTPDLKEIYTASTDQFNMTAVLDGVTAKIGNIKVHQDPEINDMGNIKFQYPFEDSITIDGKNLKSACDKDEYSVLVGAVHCSIQHVTDTEIECKPSKSPPDDIKKHKLRVKIGYLEKEVGTLEYLELYETTGFIIIMSCIAAAILIAIGVVIICCCCRYRRKHGSATPPKSLDTKGLVPEEERHSMNTYSELTTVVDPGPVPVTAPAVSTAPSVKTAPAPTTANGHNGLVRMETVLREPKYGIVNTSAEEATLVEEFLPKVEPSLRDEVKQCFIGSGHFALGKARSVIGQHARLTDGSLQQAGIAELKKLTIKTLNNPLPDQPLPAWANLALSECLRLKRFSHTHVLSIMGIGVDQQRFHILYPYMQQTILKSVVSDTSKEFSVRQLLNFGQQVAEGLEYLTSKDITHKDVAARNCMMDEFSIVKLSDAAFSWDFFEGEYVYDEQRERYLPTRWMAPESITDGYYDMRTDVWSFAVLVWELLTRGCLPFHEVTDPAEVSDYIVQGYILGKPETLSDEVYDVLRSCWSPDIEARPSIANVTRSLSNILDSDDGDTYVNSDSVTYAAQHASGKAASPRQNTGTNYYNSTNLSRV